MGRRGTTAVAWKPPIPVSRMWHRDGAQGWGTVAAAACGSPMASPGTQALVAGD